MWLTAIEADRGIAKTISVEVVGDEPEVTLGDLVQVYGLTFAPWVNRYGKIVRNFCSIPEWPAGICAPPEAYDS